MQLNKTILANKIAKKFEISKTSATRIITEIFDEIMDAAVTDGVAFTGFGTFKVIETKAREGHNPSTGEKIDIPAGKRVKFKAGKDFKDRL